MVKGFLPLVKGGFFIKKPGTKKPGFKTVKIIVERKLKLS